MVLRAFIGSALQLIDRRAHRETAAWEQDHVEPGAQTEPFGEELGGVFFWRVPHPFGIHRYSVESDRP